MGFTRPIIGIMATTEAGVIAKNNNLPWDYPDELEHFKTQTRTHVLIMGRKTFEATPDYLFLDRIPIVLSKDPSFVSHYGHTVHSLDECLLLIQNIYPTKTLFMIGGAKIAHLFLEAHLISSFLLTKIHHPYPGDTYLNLKYFDGWKENMITSNSQYTIYQLQKPIESNRSASFID